MILLQSKSNLSDRITATLERESILSPNIELPIHTAGRVKKNINNEVTILDTQPE